VNFHTTQRVTQLAEWQSVDSAVSVVFAFSQPGFFISKILTVKLTTLAAFWIILVHIMFTFSTAI